MPELLGEFVAVVPVPASAATLEKAGAKGWQEKGEMAHEFSY